MPRFETKHRNQDALLWECVVADNFGKPLVSNTYIPIKVRWIDRTQEMIDPNGKPIIVSATIVTDREIPNNSIVWKGKASDLPGTAGIPESNIMYVAASKYTPSIKNRGTRRVIGLRRYSDKMPTRAS